MAAKKSNLAITSGHSRSSYTRQYYAVQSNSNSHDFCPFTLSSSLHVGVVPDVAYDLVFR
jgi:hypothetical protein